jgi:GNAT acetyltransferase-like protein
MSQIQIRTLSFSEFSDWNRMTNESPQGTIFHKTYWLNLWGLPFKLFGCYSKNELVAGIPVVYHRKHCMNIVTSPPLTPYLGIIYKDSSSMNYVKRISFEKKITRFLVNSIIKEADVISMCFPPYNQFDLHPFMWSGFSTGVKYTYLLDVNDLDRVFKGMDSRRRSEIRKAKRDGLKVLNNASLDDFFRLNQMTLDRQNVQLPISKKNLTTIHHTLQNERVSQIIVVKDQEGRLCGGAYIVWDNKRAYYLMGGFNPEVRSSGGTALALWEAIQYTSKVLKLPEFDFEGSNIPGIERSFRQYGGILTPYFTVYRSTTFAKLIILTSSLIKSTFKQIYRKHPWLKT